MTPNERAVRAYVEAYNRGDWDAMPALFTDDAMIQGPLGEVPLAQALGIWGELHEGLENRLEIVALAVDGDQVVARYRDSGRFVGPFRAFPGEAPTGRTYEVTAMEWFECRDGRIAMRWGARDSASIRRQILG